MISPVRPYHRASGSIPFLPLGSQRQSASAIADGRSSSTRTALYSGHCTVPVCRIAVIPVLSP